MISIVEFYEVTNHLISIPYFIFDMCIVFLRNQLKLNCIVSKKTYFWHRVLLPIIEAKEKWLILCWVPLISLKRSLESRIHISSKKLDRKKETCFSLRPNFSSLLFWSIVMLPMIMCDIIFYPNLSKTFIQRSKWHFHLPQFSIFINSLSFMIIIFCYE